MTDNPQGSAPPAGDAPPETEAPPATGDTPQAPGAEQPAGVPPPAGAAPGQAVPPGQAPGYPPPGAQPPGAQPPPGYAPSPGAPPPAYSQQPGQVPVAQPVMLDPSAPITQEDKMWAAMSHASMFVFGIFGPLIIMMVHKEKSYYITYHAKQALVFQVVAVVGGIVTCGLLSLVCMVFAIIAAIKAFEGQYYSYPWMDNVKP